MDIRYFGKAKEVVEIPDLTEIQVKSYENFLQANVAQEARKNRGIESIFQETFPVENSDGSLRMEYMGYTLGRPRYTPDECRRLKLTYGAPFRVRLRLVSAEAEVVEEDVFLGEIPIMIAGGEFIINGAERVIVSQLHRSPGIDFSEDIHTSGKRLQRCKIIPERGSWIEMETTHKDLMIIQIDQSARLPVTCFLRAMSEQFSATSDIIRLFYPVNEIKVKGRNFLKTAIGAYLADDVIDPATGEIAPDLEAGDLILDEESATRIKSLGIATINVVPGNVDVTILKTLKEDNTNSHDEALLRVYLRLRPGNPPVLKKAAAMFAEKFYDETRYRLGSVGRFRLNRKFDEKVAEDTLILRPEDLLNAMRYLLAMREGKGYADDIDHLGNRRVKTVGELACDEIRKGFLKLKRTIQERMSIATDDKRTARNMVNSKVVSSAIDYFFGRGELSQVVDQSNPLAQLTHERRLSALGPGGLNRKRAGFEVRDVHNSHYGRICPIETPEGTNIGLIVSLSIYSKIDNYGFLITPFRKVVDGRVTDKIVYLRADEETNKHLAPADTVLMTDGRFKDKQVLVRYRSDISYVPAVQVDFMDVSSKQMVGISASLIPFLEHDDANRALMGSNMQRQAVPLITAEPPIVATGMESTVGAADTGMTVLARESGTVKFVDARRIMVDHLEYKMRKFESLNEKTCLNQRPIVRLGQKVKKGDVLADGAGTSNGELALGKNVLVAFMPWDGYNFEDAILFSEKLVKEDRYTSIHVEEFEVEIRETKLGREEFTCDIPSVSERILSNLDEKGVITVGTWVEPGDILVGKVSPKSKSELSPEEKLLHAIFGKAGEDVKNDSLEVPSGVTGVVIDTYHFSRKSHLSEDEIKADRKRLRECKKAFLKRIAKEIREMFKQWELALGEKVKKKGRTRGVSISDSLADDEVLVFYDALDLDELDVSAYTRSVIEKFEKIRSGFEERILDARDEMNRTVNRIQRGDELPTGVLEMVKVYIATKRRLSVGDKMAGRHGNKGVIAKILPEEDMPFLEDGTPVEMVLNPLGVPSRMNVGQILETHLGWAAHTLGFKAITPVFEGADEDEIHECLKEAGLPETGKTTLYDGRTGESFDQPVTVGYLYMLKLHHLVDDKVHARATGPYSLITQQPLGGKARFGGQRFGEMEVWALEAYGAAKILQELLTVKSDDVAGRTKIYESMVKGENVLEPGTPVSFDVLMNEIRGLGLNIFLEKHKDKKKNILKDL